MARVLSILAILCLAIALTGWLTGGPAAAQAAGFGAMIALAQALALAWRARQATRLAAAPRGVVGLAAVSFLERIVLITVLLFAGLSLLHLAALPLLLGFIAGQFGLMIAGAGVYARASI